MAPCGSCGKAAVSGDYTLTGSGTDQDGTYPSEVEARAAKIRAGGQGVVAPK